MPNSLKLRFKKLSVTKKLVLIGAFLSAISVFMPWYQDIDKFKTGDMFLGITGPLYLTGLIVFLASIASFSLISLKLFEKPQPKLPISENQFYIFSSALSVLMIIIAASVYFHPKFGINLTDKNTGIGLMIAFVANGIIMLGGILAIKRNQINFEEEGQLKPLINIEDRVQDDLEFKKDFQKKEDNFPKTVQGSIEDFSQNINDTNDIFSHDRRS